MGFAVRLQLWSPRSGRGDRWCQLEEIDAPTASGQFERPVEIDRQMTAAETEATEEFCSFRVLSDPSFDMSQLNLFLKTMF